MYEPTVYCFSVGGSNFNIHSDPNYIRGTLNLIQRLDIVPNQEGYNSVLYTFKTTHNLGKSVTLDNRYNSNQTLIF